jgi:uncharacterized membrane protein
MGRSWGDVSELSGIAQSADADHKKSIAKLIPARFRAIIVGAFCPPEGRRRETFAMAGQDAVASARDS